MLLKNPSSRVPIHLTPEVASGYSPALSVYQDNGTPTITYTSTTITISGQEFTYTSKSFSALAAEIGRSLPHIKVSTHLYGNIDSGELFYQSCDMTPEGGAVVRFLGLVTKNLERTRIRLLKPHADGPTAAWHIRINPGSYKVELNGVTYEYSIPEYATQAWSPEYGRPFVEESNARATVLETRKIILPRGPILWVGYEGGLQLFRNGEPMNRSVIEDVDENNRIIYLTTDISLNDRISANYIYREENLIYKGVNLNPALQHSPHLVDQFVLFYLLPHRTNLGQITTTTVHHIVGPTLEGAIGLLPSDTEFRLIGAVRTRQIEGASDVSVLDVRSRGGGVKDDLDAMQIQPESAFYTDIGWVTYPGNQVLIVNVPRSVLDTFEARQVREIVTRHMALGTIPIIEYSEV